MLSTCQGISWRELSRESVPSRVAPGYLLEQEKMVVLHTEIEKPKERLVEADQEHGFFNIITEMLI